MQVVHRDKLHPSVIIWSLGNEAFYGRNHKAMRDWIKSYDPSRPIHYEQDAEADCADIYSRMYASVDEIVGFAEDKTTKPKPMVLCEFIHAMGTGPGNIKEYIDAFYEHPRLQGGWVWEWANHGLLTKADDGTPYYGYGGDFGDTPNDYNFVMDGVLQSDHTPNSGLVEYKKAIEPVEVVSWSVTSAETSVEIINRLDFATLDHLVYAYSVISETGPVAEQLAPGTIDMPAGVQAGSKATLVLPGIDTQKSWKEMFLLLSFRLKESTSWANGGHELAWFQVPVYGSTVLNHPRESKGQAKLKALKSSTDLTITGHQHEWKVNLVHGTLVSWKSNGMKRIMSDYPLQPSFYRAPTDNDAPQDGRDWKDRMLHLARLHTRSAAWREEGDTVILELEQKFGPPVLSWSLALHTTYTFSPSGVVRVHVEGMPEGSNLPKTLPRIGVTMGLPKEFQHVKWFGRGPAESYKDMKMSQKVDVHGVAKVDDLWQPGAPEFPQEHANRTDTRWLQISDGGSNVLNAQFYNIISRERRWLFDFMACHYDVADIDEAQHPYELERKKKDVVILRLDADHHGLGTGSCGPKTMEKYALKTEQFEFGLLLW